MAARKKSKPSNEISLTREYDAPVALVWDAWTDPQQAARWWGPRGFTLTTHSKDFRPGGTWNYTMHGPDGTDYPNTTVYHEIEKHRRMVYDHGGHGDRPPLFRVTVLFTEIKGGKTKMDMTMTLATPEAAESTRQFIKKAGGDATWDRLSEYLAKQASDREIFVLNRSFDVDLETMYAMWTEPKHIAKWLSPTGFDMRFLRADVRPGGSSFYVVTGPGGAEMHGRVFYDALEKPRRIVYRQQFVDKDEKVARHPMSPSWPETMLTTVLLEEEEPGRTRVAIRWEAKDPTRDELQTFVKARGGMTQGWTGSLDKLDDCLGELEF